MLRAWPREACCRFCQQGAPRREQPQIQRACMPCIIATSSTGPPGRRPQPYTARRHTPPATDLEQHGVSAEELEGLHGLGVQGDDRVVVVHGCGGAARGHTASAARPGCACGGGGRTAKQRPRRRPAQALEPQPARLPAHHRPPPACWGSSCAPGLRMGGNACQRHHEARVRGHARPRPRAPHSLAVLKSFFCGLRGRAQCVRQGRAVGCQARQNRSKLLIGALTLRSG